MSSSWCFQTGSFKLVRSKGLRYVMMLGPGAARGHRGVALLRSGEILEEPQGKALRDFFNQGAARRAGRGTGAGVPVASGPRRRST